MKKIITIIAVLAALGAVAFVSLKGSGPQIMTMTIPVKGMTCKGCQQNIENELAQMLGVIKANASHESAELTVEFDKKQLNPEKIVETVNNIGFSASLPSK